MAKKGLFTQRLPRLTQSFDQMLGETERLGSAARTTGIEGQLDFDARDAVTDFGQGFVDEAREGLSQDFEGLVGESVGSGRLRTGFFQRDAGRLFQDFNRRVANAIAMQSMQAAGLNLQNLQGLSSTGLDMLSQQTDILAGAFDRATAEKNAEGGGFWKKAIGGALGFAAGSVLPGIGNKIGAALGSKIAGSIGGSDED